eukprot:6099713-Amphidinium_carterae.1
MVVADAYQETCIGMSAGLLFVAGPGQQRTVDEGKFMGQCAVDFLHATSHVHVPVAMARPLQVLLALSTRWRCAGAATMGTTWRSSHMRH